MFVGLVIFVHPGFSTHCHGTACQAALCRSFPVGCGALSTPAELQNSLSRARLALPLLMWSRRNGAPAAIASADQSALALVAQGTGSSSSMTFTAPAGREQHPGPHFCAYILPAVQDMMHWTLHWAARSRGLCPHGMIHASQLRTPTHVSKGGVWSSGGRAK